MPKSGYKAVTISEEKYEQVKRSMEELNRQAGVRRFRNVSHFVEEAITHMAMGTIKNQSESPEEIIQKVVEVMWDRSALLKGVFDQILNMKVEEATNTLEGLFTTEEMEHLKRICATIKPKEKKKGDNPGHGGKAHVLMDMGGKILYMNKCAQSFMPNRVVGSSLFDGTVLTRDSQVVARKMLEKILTSKEGFVDELALSYKDGKKIHVSGSARLVPGNDGEKVFELIFYESQVKKIEA